MRDLQAYLRACVAANGDPDAIAPARGTRGSTATATPSTSSAPRCSPQGRDEMPAVDAEGHRLRAVDGLQRPQSLPAAAVARYVPGAMAKNPDPNLALTNLAGRTRTLDDW